MPKSILDIPREEFIKKLLDTMCFISEFADYRRGNSNPEEIEFKSFVPTLADKMIFRKIIESDYDNMAEEVKKNDKGILHYNSIAINILNTQYAPFWLTKEQRCTVSESWERFNSYHDFYIEKYEKRRKKCQI